MFICQPFPLIREGSRHRIGAGKAPDYHVLESLSGCPSGWLSASGKSDHSGRTGLHQLSFFSAYATANQCHVPLARHLVYQHPTNNRFPMFTYGTSSGNTEILAKFDCKLKCAEGTCMQSRALHDWIDCTGGTMPYR